MRFSSLCSRVSLRPLPCLLVLLGSPLGAGCGDDDSPVLEPDAGNRGQSDATSDGNPSDGGTSSDEGDGGNGGDGGGNEGDGGTNGNTSGSGCDAGSSCGSAGDNSAGGEGTAGEDGGPPGEPMGCGQLDTGKLGQGTWDPRFTIAGVTGHDGITPTVHDFVVDGDGSVLATGRFAYHEGAPVAPLLRLNDEGWTPAHNEWTLNPPGDGFAALALDGGGQLALATADSFGERDGEIWLDVNGQQRVIAAFSGQLRTLVWYDGLLYAAGAFVLDETSGGIANLAVWDGDTWAAPLGGDADGPVLELLVADDALYVGGAFTSVGGIESANVAVFDGAAWTPLPLPDALAVYALALSETGELYAGGALGELSAAGGVVQRVGETWEVVGGGLAQYQTRGVVSDLVAHDGVLDVAGCFSAAGGLADAEGAVPTTGLARFTGQQWQSLNADTQVASPWFQPAVCGDESVDALWDMEFQRLLFTNGRLFAGGSFAGVEGVQSQSLAVYEDARWVAQGDAGLGLGGSLDRVVAGGPACDVYGLGAFTHVGGQSLPGRVAHFGDGAWQVFTDDLPSDAYCPTVDVAPDGTLAVGCLVFNEDSTVRGVVLTADNNELVELEVDAALPPVHALEWDSSGKLWVGGGESNGYVATIEAGHLTVLSDDFDGVVQFLDVRPGDDVLAAGVFQTVGTTPARRIARYVDGNWQALGEGLRGDPQAIARTRDAVYASTYDVGDGSYLLGVFSGETWQELAGGDSNLALENFYSFNRILPVEGGVLVAGTAELVDGSGRGALVFQDGTFRPIGGGGVHGIIVSGLAVAKDALWVGGVIAEASSGDALVSSVGVARLSW